jgi:hypothetical protein
MGWYELNNAKANAINANTAIKIQSWNKQVYDTYMRERAQHMAYKKNLTVEQAKAAEKRMAEREAKLRTDPEPEDIQNGDALNALLVDLSDPSIDYSSWRLAQVPLPEDLSLRELVFRFAPKSRDRDAQALSKGLIALGRLDVEGRWPIFIPEQNVGPERREYEAAYRKVRDQSLEGALDLGEIQGLDLAIKKLKEKVGTAVPEYRGFRKEAVKYVDELEKSTRMFDALTISFAQEMIGDTQRHKAGTVGELLAFMRKYSLMFAAADLIPGGGEKYRRVYGLLQEQKEKLGLGRGQAPAQAQAAEAAPANANPAVPGALGPDARQKAIAQLEKAKGAMESVPLKKEPPKKKGKEKAADRENIIAFLDNCIDNLKKNQSPDSPLRRADETLSAWIKSNPLPANRQKLAEAKRFIDAAKDILGRN